MSVPSYEPAMTKMQMAAGLSSSNNITPTPSTSTAKPHITHPPTAPSPQSRPQHSVRSHLYDLLPLPKHALFHIKLTIHQLWNVPLVGGDFSVRWKFQKVHSVRGSPGGGHGGGGAHRKSSKGKGKGKIGVHLGVDQDSTEASTLDLPPRSPGRSTISLQDEEGSSSGHASPHISNSPLPSSTNLLSQEARGRTRYVPLEDHNVKWSQSVSVAVQMAVSRETMDLLPSELKLVIEQLYVHGDPDAPQQPRLGIVKLNLAEYVDKGAVTRRYLLRESKTNATLQLTIEANHIGGEKHYKAPPLQKGEVMAEVSTLLERSPYGTLPRHSYTRKPSNYSTISRNTAGNSTARLVAPSPLPRRRSRSFVGSPTHDSIDELLSSPKNMNSIRTTDNIIEAIFNPVPTSSTSPSPFTYYSPPKPRPPPLVLSQGSIRSKASEESRSVATSSTSQSFPNVDQPNGSGQSMHSQSDSYQASSSSASHSIDSSPRLGVPHNQPRKWWRKLTGSKVPLATPGGTNEGKNVPPSPSLMNTSHYLPGPLTQSTLDVASRSSRNGASSANFGGDEGGHGTGLQIFVRRPTSPVE